MVGSDEEVTRKLSSYAWLHRRARLGLFVYDPGMLLAIGDRVSFVTAKGPVFEANRNEIKVKWPRSALGSAIYLTVGEKLYRLSLARPSGATTFEATRKELDKDLKVAGLVFLGGDFAELDKQFFDVRRGRTSGKAWKAYFGAEMAAIAPEEHATAPEEHATAPEEHE